MTTRKRLKRLVRTRAAKTGESYTSALRHFRDQTPKEREVSPDQDRRVPARCSFCGKYQDQVKKLIAGPGVFICDECVLLCTDILVPSPEDGAELLAGGEGRQRAAPTPEGSRPDPDVEARIRRYVTEAVGRIEAEVGTSTRLAARIDVMATPAGTRVDVHTPRPGMLIGTGGSTMEGLRSGLAEITGGHVSLNLVPMRD